MDMEDANAFEINSLGNTKEIKDPALHSWGFLLKVLNALNTLVILGIYKC